MANSKTYYWINTTLIPKTTHSTTNNK